MDDEMFSKMEKVVSGKNITLSEYGRDAIGVQLRSDLELEEYEFMTFHDVKPAFEEFAGVLKGIVANVDEMNSRLKNLSEFDNDRFNKLEEMVYELMLFNSIANLFSRIDVIEKKLGIERNE